MKKQLWRLHSWLGLFAGAALLVIGLTGSLLVFRDEVEGLFNPDLIQVDPAGRERLPIDTLLTGAQDAIPEHRVTGWALRQNGRLADLAYLVALDDDERFSFVAVNPHAGELPKSPRSCRSTLAG